MKLLVIAMLVASVFPMVAQAQMNHEVTVVSGVIDGSKTPERIEDRHAYRMFLLAAAGDFRNPESLKANRQAFFLSARLTDTEAQQVDIILYDFASEYEGNIDAYNRRAEQAGLANKPVPNVKLLLARQDVLVAKTRLKIEQLIDSDRMARLHQFIQSEKRNMKVAGE